MRVAFSFIDSAKWTGGHNYLLNLFRAIQSSEECQVHPVLFCGEDASEKDLRSFREIGGVEIVRSSEFDEQRKAMRFLRAILLGIDCNVLQLFRHQRIDVVFESATFYGWKFPIPAIAWLPDFQHRHLPSQFKFLAYWRRELGFRAQVAFGRIIMLSSENARKDCEQFYWGATGNVMVVPFPVFISTDLIEEFPENVTYFYQLPPTFFYLPSQLWKHKNHMIVIEALGLLKRAGVEVVVAVTGSSQNSQDPGYVRELNARIESLGLRNNFRILGFVPRRNVVSLLRVCTAMINPSFFEGWSSTVEEARALGVPMVLSDIAVHREQMGNGAIFFAPNKADDLAAKLREMTLAVLPVTRARALVPINSKRQRLLSQDFVRVCERALGSFHG